jgi:hypothetical protein
LPLENLDHAGVNKRLQQISAEMYQLLHEQRIWLSNGVKIAEMSDQEADEQVGKNRRLLRLAKELSELPEASLMQNATK